MARLVFGMNQSLDGYVDHTAFAPGPVLFRHFIAEAQGQTGRLVPRPAPGWRPRIEGVPRPWGDQR